ncbi:hypothetical protein QFC19_004983, partial [Naganishia cerealis]
MASDGANAGSIQIAETGKSEESRGGRVQEDEAGSVVEDGRDAVPDQASSGEEDEGEVDGNGEGDAEPDGEDEDEDDEDDEDDDDDDDDEEGSIDLEDGQDQDLGDSPVFISMRNGPLGISDLLLPSAAVDAEVRVKIEPLGEHEQGQSQASDIVLTESRGPGQNVTEITHQSTTLATITTSTDVISIDSSSQMQDSQPQNEAPLAMEDTVASGKVEGEDIDTAVNVLVPRPGKKKKARAKSPSPPPQAAPKARATIRVTFHLFDDHEGPDGLPSNMEADPLAGAQQEGQDQSTSPCAVVNGNGVTPSLASPEQRNSTTPAEAALPPASATPSVSPALPAPAVFSTIPATLPLTELPVEHQSELTGTATPKPSVAPSHDGMEPKFRIVNFKDASIAQGQVDSDYYVSPSGWNAAETDADEDEDDDDMEVDGVEDGKPKKNKKRKFQALLMNGGGDGAVNSGNGAIEDSSRNSNTIKLEPAASNAAPGSILEAMMNGSDEAELARLAAELDKKYNTSSKPKRKRVIQQDDYDYKDPFIDDSELQMDQPVLLQRPAKVGYYVQKGAVELIKDEEETS